MLPKTTSKQRTADPMEVGNDIDLSHFAPTPYTPAEEEVILARVGKQLKESLPSLKEVEKRVTSLVQVSVVRWAVVFSIAIACMITGILFLQPPDSLLPKTKTQAMHHLSFQGTQLVVKKRRRVISVRLKKGIRSGVISSPGHWRSRIYSSAPLSLLFVPRQQVQWHLKQGEIHTSVVPSSVKLFTVVFRKIKVSVRGTVFSVITGKHWMRVEVWRGKVDVSNEGKLISLTARQGLRIQLSSPSQYHHYSLPTPSLKEPIKRLSWLMRKASKESFDYASDMLEMVRYPLRKRTRSVLEVTDFLRQQKHYLMAQQLLERIADLPTFTQERESALFEAGQLCYDRVPIPKDCQALLHRYLQRYPKGVYRNIVRLLYVRDELRQGKSCDSLRALQNPSIRNDPVVRQFCDSKKNRTRP